MKYAKAVTVITVASIFPANSTFAQEAKTTDAQTKEEVRKEALEKPVKMMVQWMKDNLQLSPQQEIELLDFYLSTQLYFTTMDNEVSDPSKEESMAKQEAKLKEVLTNKQMEEFMRRKDDMQSVLMQNLPGK